MFHFFERWQSGLRWLARYVLNLRRLLCAYSEQPRRRAANEFSSPDMDCHATLTRAVMQPRARYHTCRAERASKAQNRNGWFRSRTSGLSKRRMEHGLKWDQVTFTGARISIPALSTTIAVTVQAKSVTNLAFIS